jgi:hypothetical protein
VRGQAGRGAPGHDQVDWKSHQLGRERGKSLGLTLGKPVQKKMALSFDVAQVSQPMPQSLERRPGLVRENTDFPKATRFLRNAGARPSNNCAADKPNKLTPLELTKLHLHTPGLMAFVAGLRITSEDRKT